MDGHTIYIAGRWVFTVNKHPCLFLSSVCDGRESCSCVFVCLSPSPAHTPAVVLWMDFNSAKIIRVGDRLATQPAGKGRQKLMASSFFTFTRSIFHDRFAVGRRRKCR